VIDWINLGSNALWIAGCGLAFACLSYASWKASIEGAKLKDILQETNIQGMLNLAGVLFAIGLASTSDKWYEIGLWIILALLFLWNTGLAVHKIRIRER